MTQKGFMAIHTDEIIRINRDMGGTISGSVRSMQRNDGSKAMKVSLENIIATRSIEFTFLERIARSEVAFRGRLLQSYGIQSVEIRSPAFFMENSMSY